MKLIKIFIIACMAMTSCSIAIDDYEWMSTMARLGRKSKDCTYTISVDTPKNKTATNYIYIIEFDHNDNMIYRSKLIECPPGYCETFVPYRSTVRIRVVFESSISWISVIREIDHDLNVKGETKIEISDNIII